MDEFDAEFKRMMSDTSQEVTAEAQSNREKYLRLFEAALKRILTLRQEDRTAEWNLEYKRLCLAFCLMSPYAVMRVAQAAYRVDRSLTYQEQIEAIFGEHAQEVLDFFPDPASLGEYAQRWLKFFPDHGTIEES